MMHIHMYVRRYSAHANHWFFSLWPSDVQSSIGNMSSAAELLALTDTAVQSLLNAGTTDNVEGMFDLQVSPITASV